MLVGLVLGCVKHYLTVVHFSISLKGKFNSHPYQKPFPFPRHLFQHLETLNHWAFSRAPEAVGSHHIDEMIPPKTVIAPYS